MATYINTLDVTNLVKISKKKHLKFNMLMNYCIGKAAVPIKEFFFLPINDELILQMSHFAVGVMLINKKKELSHCDIEFNDDLETFNRAYLKYTKEVAETSENRYLFGDTIDIQTSAVPGVDMDYAIPMFNGLVALPFMVWFKYKKKGFRYYLTITGQFHCLQMDTIHVGQFFGNLQKEINDLQVN